MTRYNRHALCAAALGLLLLVGVSTAHAQSTIPVRVSTRSLAMGGATLLSSGPIEAGYYNPGSLTLNRGFSLYIPMVQATVDNNFLDTVKWIDDHQADFDDFDSMSDPDKLAFINEVNDEIGNKWIAVNVDPMIGVQVGSFSLSAYSVTRANVRMATSTAFPYQEPEIQAYAINDIVFNAGVGLQLAPLLHGGVGVRYVNRRMSDGIVTVSSEDGGSITDLFGEASESDGESINGFALDVGGTFTLTQAFAVGGVIRGLVSSMEDEDWEPELSVGARVKPLELLMGIPLVFVRDITVEANISDLANSRDEDYAEKLQLGAEVKIPLFALRAGMNRGRISYGLGMHFLVVDLAVAKATVPLILPDGVFDDEIFSVSVGIGF